MEDMKPFRLNNYVIFDRIGIGGMATVYLARELKDIPKLVCIKVLTPETNDALKEELFEDEIATAYRLEIPEIARIFDSGLAGDTRYFVMEHIHGKSLTDILRQSRNTGIDIPLDFILNAFLGYAKGLKYAYDTVSLFEAGENIQKWKKGLKLVHRDISPQNLMITYNGDPKIIDFGVAFTTKSKKSEEFFVGKPSYMAPEYIINARIKGAGNAEDAGLIGNHEIRDIDYKVDIYGLGVVLWEVLTGERAYPLRGDPKDEDSVRRQQNLIINQQLESPSTYNPNIPEDLESLIMRMLAKDPRSRSRNYESIVKELNRILRKVNSGYTESDGREFMARLFAESIKKEESLFVGYNRHSIKDFLDHPQAPEALPSKDEVSPLETLSIKDTYDFSGLDLDSAIFEGTLRMSSDLYKIKKKEKIKVLSDSNDLLELRKGSSDYRYGSAKKKKIIGILMIASLAAFVWQQLGLKPHRSVSTIDKYNAINEAARKTQTGHIDALLENKDGIYSSNKLFWKEGKFVKLTKWRLMLRKGEDLTNVIPVGAYVEVKNYRRSRHWIMINGIEQEPDGNHRVGVPINKEFKFSVVPKDDSYERHHSDYKVKVGEFIKVFVPDPEKRVVKK